MRLPLPLLDSPFFLFTNEEEFAKAMGESISPEERNEITRLLAIFLPPVLSRTTLATIFGINPGLIWSFENRQKRHYRIFTIPKGKGAVRTITAPRVALKIIQKWLSVQIQKAFTPSAHVYGFVSGRSHVDAAMVHSKAQWVFSVDLLNFFQTTPEPMVTEALETIGFGPDGAKLLSRLACFQGVLAQGSPSSPILSNICFQVIDAELGKIAEKYGVRLTRYADDIVFSGLAEFPVGLNEDVQNLFLSTPWKLAAQKTQFAKLPNRLKVHGLLVHGDDVRLTKGYRNKLRAYRNLIKYDKVSGDVLSRMKGHIQYGDFVSHRSNVNKPSPTASQTDVS